MALTITDLIFWIVGALICFFGSFNSSCYLFAILCVDSLRSLLDIHEAVLLYFSMIR